MELMQTRMKSEKMKKKIIFRVYVRREGDLARFLSMTMLGECIMDLSSSKTLLTNIASRFLIFLVSFFFLTFYSENYIDGFVFPYCVLFSHINFFFNSLLYVKRVKILNHYEFFFFFFFYIIYCRVVINMLVVCNLLNYLRGWYSIIG